MPVKSSRIEPSDLMTPAEVCHRLRIDKSTLSRWVSTGRIAPAMDVGMRLYRRADVERIAAEREAAAS